MRFAALFVFLALGAAAARAQEPRPARSPEPRIVHACMSAQEIREAVAARRLIEPMQAVRTAVRVTHAEPLRSQLCRNRDGLEYRLTLLRRDGKIVRVFMNASSGKLIVIARPLIRPKALERRALAEHAKPAERARAAERVKPPLPPRGKIPPPPQKSKLAASTPPQEPKAALKPPAPKPASAAAPHPQEFPLAPARRRGR